MNKIKHQKKFEALPWKRPNLNSSKPKVFADTRLKSSHSATKNYNFDCTRCEDRIKKESRLVVALQEKQINLKKCLEFIDQLMVQNESLRKNVQTRDKTKQKKYKYKLQDSKFIRDAFSSPIKEQQQHKKQIKSIKFQRDKLFQLVKQLEKQNQKLLKAKQQSQVCHSRIITSFKDDPKTFSQPMKNSSVVNSGIKSEPNEFMDVQLMKLKEPSQDMRLLQIINVLREEKQYNSQKILRLQSMYKKSIKNYEDLLSKYQNQLQKNDNLTFQKQKLALLLKQIQEQSQRMKNSRGGRNTTQSDSQDQINRLNNVINENLRQYNINFLKIKGQFDSSIKEKMKIQATNKQLQQQILQLQQKYSQLRNENTEQFERIIHFKKQKQTQQNSIKQVIQKKQQQIQHLNQIIQKMTLQTTQKRQALKNTSDKQTQYNIEKLEKSTQKTSQTFLNQQDLIGQIIQKDMEINKLELQNIKLQELIAEFKGRSRENSDPNLSLAQCKIQNDKLVNQIYDKDLKIYELEKQLKTMDSGREAQKKDKIYEWE